MVSGEIEVIYGTSCGCSSLALGKGIEALTEQKKVILIRFLKGTVSNDSWGSLRLLEPNLKVFSFEKSDGFFENLSEEEKAEELHNIRNGFNFANKVAGTGECDLLILDEVLGLIDQNIITLEDFKHFLDSKEEDTSVILTGRVFPEELMPYADRISTINYTEVDKQE